MRLDKKLKKKLLLNTPYFLFVYLFDKVAQGISFSRWKIWIPPCKE